MLNLECIPFQIKTPDQDEMAAAGLGVDLGVTIVAVVKEYDTDNVMQPIPQAVELTLPLSAEAVTKMVLAKLPFKLHLGNPVWQIPEGAAPLAESDAPLEKSRVTITAHGARLVFRRAKDTPNKNHYNVFYGKADVGYLRLLGGMWCGKVHVMGQTHSQYQEETFKAACDRHCLEIGTILTHAAPADEDGMDV